LPNRSKKSCKQFAALEIDTMYSKIQCDQIVVIVQLLQTCENMLVTLWSGDKIIATIGEEKGGKSVECFTKICKEIKWQMIFFDI
jgi:hypothetical protein